MNMDEILAILARIEQDYNLTTTVEDDITLVDVEGLHNNFRLSISPETCAVYTDTWHEHYDDPPSNLESLLRALLSGNVHIVVKYRGDKPVSHRVKVIQDNGPSYRSWTWSLKSPFWRRKSFKTFTYQAANRRDKND